MYCVHKCIYLWIFILYRSMLWVRVSVCVYMHVCVLMRIPSCIDLLPCHLFVSHVLIFFLYVYLLNKWFLISDFNNISHSHFKSIMNVIDLLLVLTSNPLQCIATTSCDTRFSGIEGHIRCGLSEIIIGTDCMNNTSRFQSLPIGAPVTNMDFVISVSKHCLKLWC